MPLPIPIDVVESILLGPVDNRRQLQDSPILGDVWQAYADDPESIQDLLITPFRDKSTGKVASEIKEGIKKTRPAGKPGGSAGIAHLQGILAARLDFGEVLRVLVPRTQWWHERTIRDQLADKFEQQQLGNLLDEIFKAALFRDRRLLPPAARDDFSALERYVALAGLILWARKAKRPRRGARPTDEEVIGMARKNRRAIARGLIDLFKTISDETTGNDKEEKLIFQVSLNRRALPALDRSVPAVKGDAAHKLFEVNCSRISWAVVDSGVDGTHPALEGRVTETYDFTRVRKIVSGDIAAADLKDLVGTKGTKKARQDLDQIGRDVDEDRPINWALVEQFIKVTAPSSPAGNHGTHVAGILGAKGDDDHPNGMCPDIRILDFRVLANSLEDTEFGVIAALQFIRFLNERNISYRRVHGANLSLSIPHSVRNYACGSTPVCNECERLVESGVVVVAAAGNHGYQRFETRTGLFESYAALSITDPGNADGVITVGATHGHAPHTYGVSFFSSRGPTGDGRMKPDLVAPGERIEAPVPGGEWAQESGTSMSAPHVSGAAAMLMARYPELIGNPRRIKRILCESATDLGRERSFQGTGLLDVLRAFQSI